MTAGTTGGLPALPRVPLLAVDATPLQPAPRLSAELDVEVWLKRDDLTGLGLGGNKVRGLEFALGEAELRGADCLVTGSGPQSNWAMLAALAARVRGLDAHLVHYGPPAPVQGNRRLSAIAGAEVVFTGDPDRETVDAAIEHRAERLRAEGRRPYVLPRGGATPLGAVGYVQATLELTAQLQRERLAPEGLWLATGSCATQAGLVAGVRWLGLDLQVVGVTVSRPRAECEQRVAELADGALARLGVAAGTDSPVRILDGWLGPGYGRASAAGRAATALLARTEGVFLDPVFGAKAMAALVDACRQGRVAGPVVFVVTGGAPTLFTEAGALPGEEGSP